jgi:transcriptional regulator with XRE-family HTH domain
MGKRHQPEKVIKAFGLKIRGLRNERGWTLEQTEEHGWPSWRHLQKIERGKNVTLETVVNLANLFGVTPAELLED